MTAPQAIRNTRRIAEQCEFTLADLGYRFPDYPLPTGRDADRLPARAHVAGARERYGSDHGARRAQLEHELAVIGKLDLAGYFLIVWDIVRFCREQGILAQGRGSAANSAVCYALGITAVDAVGMELLFERFLSEERGEWPDIDIDLPERRPARAGDPVRLPALRRARRGDDRQRHHLPHAQRRARGRQGARVLARAQVDRLSKLLQRFEFRDDQDELAQQLRAGGVDPDAPRVHLLVDLVDRIQNLPRHLGQHSGGMVIAAGRLDEVVPLEPATMPGRVVVQWDKDDCADLGIIKVDLLGLGMMAVLEEAIPLIRAHEGVEVDLAHLPATIPTVYAMLQRADTIGVFQVESRAQMATLPRMKPDRLLRSRRRGGDHPPRADRRPDGASVSEPPHGPRAGDLRASRPRADPQAHARRAALPGAAAAHGDDARRLHRRRGGGAAPRDGLQALGRAHARRSRSGCAPAWRRAASPARRADDIVRSITSFALYGFPESHAASFALLAYASAYLRAHHLAAFTWRHAQQLAARLLHPATLVKDAQRHGLRVLPIDAACSQWRCTWESGGVRLGLRYVRGFSAETGARLVAERERTPFDSLADLARRAAPKRNEIEALAECGALASLDPRAGERRAALGRRPRSSAIPRRCSPARRLPTPSATCRSTRSIRSRPRSPTTAPPASPPACT